MKITFPTATLLLSIAGSAIVNGMAIRRGLDMGPFYMTIMSSADADDINSPVRLMSAKPSRMGWDTHYLEPSGRPHDTQFWIDHLGRLKISYYEDQLVNFKPIPGFAKFPIPAKGKTPQGREKYLEPLVFRPGSNPGGPQMFSSPTFGVDKKGYLFVDQNGGYGSRFFICSDTTHNKLQSVLNTKFTAVHHVRDPGKKIPFDKNCNEVKLVIFRATKSAGV